MIADGSESRAFMRWTVVGLLAAVVSAALMFSIRTEYAPIPAWMHLAGGFVVVCILVMPVRSDTPPGKDRRLERLIWLRTRFWLLLPWFIVPGAVWLSTRWFQHSTQALLPGGYEIARAWRGAMNIALLLIAFGYVSGFAIWCIRFRTLCARAGLTGWSARLPIGAIVLSFISATWAALTVLFAMADD